MLLSCSLFTRKRTCQSCARRGLRRSVFADLKGLVIRVKGVGLAASLPPMSLRVRHDEPLYHQRSQSGHFEPSLDASSVRSDVISSIKILSLRHRGWRLSVGLLGIEVWNWGLRVWGLGFEVGVWGSGFRVPGSGFRVQDPGFRVQNSEFRIQNSEFRVQGSGFRVQGLGVGVAPSQCKSLPSVSSRSSFRLPFLRSTGYGSLEFRL